MDLKMAAGLLLLLLLGLCSAHPGHNGGGEAERSTDTPGGEDITETILRMNNGSLDFLEGDVLLPRTRSAMKCIRSPTSCLWPKSDNGRVEIAYALSDKYDSAERKEIVRALKAFETKTCLRFFPRRNQRAYLNFEPRYGCAAYMGYSGGKQTVTLAKFGCVSFGIIQHEVMHALGFYHEQNRSDRDQYVRILWDNMIKVFKNNFEKAETDNRTPYDYSSIMHYSKHAFSENLGATIVPIPDRGISIGQRKGLSRLDVRKINLMYKCNKY